MSRQAPARTPSVMDVFLQQPPVTRTLVAAVILTSVACYSNILSLYYIAFVPQLLYKKLPPQIWRLATPFWLTGPKFNMLMDPIVLYQYANSIETQSPRFKRPGDFFVYIGFVKAIILLLSGLLLGNYIFMDALLLALAYTFAQDNPNRQQTFFILSFSARYLPFVMLGLTFVMTGGALDRVYNQATGLVAAHAYDFLTRIWPRFGGGRDWIAAMTPQAVRNVFGEGRPGQGRSTVSTGFGTAFRTPQPPPAGSGGSSWTSGSSWGSRGAGRRLGG